MRDVIRLIVVLERAICAPEGGDDSSSLTTPTKYLSKHSQKHPCLAPETEIRHPTHSSSCILVARYSEVCMRADTGRRRRPEHRVNGRESLS
jgi:hypothetical protein